jgi:elongation of very long chain fatty acids protein 4
MLANLLGWAAEESAELHQGVDVGDLGMWGPRGVFFSNHPVVRALVSPVCFLGLPLGFLAAVVLGLHVMQKAPALAFPRAVQLYNVVQIVYCSYMVYGLMPSWRNPFGINTEFTSEAEWFVFLHYMSKYLDWCDTVFIVLKKKRQQLSLLHVYHHATISAVWGYLCYTGNGNGTAAYGAWINSLTHVLMYTHYLWTAMGFRNPLKRWLTRWQIAQFWSCIVHALLVVALENVLPAGPAWLQVAYQMTMVYLFTWKMHYVPSCVPELTEDKRQ